MAFHRTMLNLVRGASAILALAVAVTCAHAGLDRSIEKMLGKQSRDAVESQYVVIATGPAAEYVQRTGRRLVEVAPRHDIEYTFKLIDTDQVNAFALPWGYVYVTTGMLRFVDSSDELAGVMGHEIAHVAEKHSLSQFKTQFWATMLFGVIDAPATLLTAGQVGATFYLLRHSRKDEQAADRLGAGYAYLAGYDPSQLSGFLRKLDKEQKDHPSKLEIYLSTHPTEERREQRLAELPEVNQKNPEVVARTAKGFLDRHLPNQAVVEYRRGVALAPNDSIARAGLARAYAELGAADLARQELGRAAALSSGDKQQTEALLASSPATPSLTAAEPSEADQAVLKQALDAAAAWNADAQDPVRRIEERSKSLQDKVKQLAQRMNMVGTFGSPGYGAERVMDKAGIALYLIAETRDRVNGAAEDLKSSSSGAADVLGLVKQSYARPASADDRAQWQALAAEIGSAIAGASDQGGRVAQQALEAAKRADDAAGQLGSALNSLAANFDSFGGARGMPFMGLAEGDVDRALKTARAAFEASRKVDAALHDWTVRELSWRLSAAYLDTPARERPALRRMAAAMIGIDAQSLAPEPAASGVPAAPEHGAPAPGFGATLVKAIAARTAAQKAEASPKQPQPASAAPAGGADAPAPSGDSAPKQAAAPQAPTGDDLMLKLILADAKREADARSQWRGIAAATSAAKTASSP
jgi:Zn-dependent protease with chaperone function